MAGAQSTPRAVRQCDSPSLVPRPVVALMSSEWTRAWQSPLESHPASSVPQVRRLDLRLLIPFLTIDRVVEEGKELVVLLLGERIVLVIVTLGTGECRAQPKSCSSVGAIHHTFDAGFLGVHSTFHVDHRVAMKPGSNFLIERGIGQHVACELFDSELIKRQIPVESFDHPVAVFPH